MYRSFPLRALRRSLASSSASQSSAATAILPSSRAFPAAFVHSNTTANFKQSISNANAAAAATPSAASVSEVPTYRSVDASSAASTTPSGHMKGTKRAWHLFDARGQVVGRLASRIATLLCGKHRPDYTPRLDTGDAVVVLNAKHLKFTGSKWQKKLYRYHTGYAGGLKEIPAHRWRESHPDRILRHAVAGMIHKTKLKIPRLARLKIYPGLVHPHVGQFPFDVIAQVPHLKAEREKELKEMAAVKQAEIDAANFINTGGKKVEKKVVPIADPDLQGEDDGTMPQDPEIRKAIVKDREQRKGKPIVML